MIIDCFSEQPGLARDEVNSWTPLPGGSSANIACGLAKLGNLVDFVGAIGKDHWGDALVQLLDDMGVGREGVQRRIKAPTRKVYVSRNADNEVIFAGFSDDPTVFADAHLFADALNPALFIRASFLILGTLSMAYLDTRQSLERAVDIAREQNVSILVDVNWRPMFWPQPAAAPALVYDLIQKAQYLKVSDDEAEWLFATTSASAIAHQLPHLKGVLVTTSEQGCRYWLMNNAGALPGFNLDSEDATGANDAFTAGFVHQLLQRGEACLQDPNVARQVVTYASAVSALTTTRPGAIAALPTPTEIAAFLYLNKLTPIH